MARHHHRPLPFCAALHTPVARLAAGSPASCLTCDGAGCDGAGELLSGHKGLS
jgi:hypothetical protein